MAGKWDYRGPKWDYRGVKWDYRGPKWAYRGSKSEYRGAGGGAGERASVAEDVFSRATALGGLLVVSFVAPVGSGWRGGPDGRYSPGTSPRDVAVRAVAAGVDQQDRRDSTSASNKAKR
jgi:hypothetical protein